MKVSVNFLLHRPNIPLGSISCVDVWRLLLGLIYFDSLVSSYSIWTNRSRCCDGNMIVEKNIQMKLEHRQTLDFLCPKLCMLQYPWAVFSGLCTHPMRITLPENYLVSLAASPAVTCLCVGLRSQTHTQ